MTPENECVPAVGLSPGSPHNEQKTRQFDRCRQGTAGATGDTQWLSMWHERARRREPTESESQRFSRTSQYRIGGIAKDERSLSPTRSTAPSPQAAAK
jgi:hypothetical protein